MNVTVETGCCIRGVVVFNGWLYSVFMVACLLHGFAVSSCSCIDPSVKMQEDPL